MTATYEVDDAEEPVPASGYRTYEVFQRERGEQQVVVQDLGVDLLRRPQR